MPRRKRMTLQDVIKIGKDMGVDEIEIDGIKVKFREPAADIPRMEEELPTDWKEDELRMLLHSTDLSDEEITKMSR